MNPLALLPYALGAYGGVQGYRSARDRGASGLGALLSGAAGAFGGYSLGQLGGFAGRAGFGSTVPTFANLPGISTLPGMSRFTTPAVSKYLGTDKGTGGKLVPNPAFKEAQKSGSILDFFKNEKGDYDPLKVGGSLAALTFLGGAYDQGPVDMYMPGYNMGVLDIQKNRPGYTFIDPVTGQEKEYEKMYVPEEAGRGQKRIQNLSFEKVRLRSGGLAEIKKFNEGGINYLPSKMTHDENDSNNYVRASGYVEDGAGVGDKDEDTMLAQLADGEFVTRADGVLGAGIIAGANPNSMKDMREKGAAYFYEQQKRYKRVFDLLKENNAISKEKTN
tara:strand:- start:365 stop:1360 length:996 start_codon:yes stop_codon:yes gene_type:complete